MKSRYSFYGEFSSLVESMNPNPPIHHVDSPKIFPYRLYIFQPYLRCSRNMYGNILSHLYVWEYILEYLRCFIPVQAASSSWKLTISAQPVRAKMRRCSLQKGRDREASSGQIRRKKKQMYMYMHMYINHIVYIHLLTVHTLHCIALH